MKPRLFKGDMIKVRDNHEFYPGLVGRFEFYGGPKKDVAVCVNVAKSNECKKTYFAVNPTDCKRIAG